MRQTHAQIAADIRRLFDTLAPYGIRRPSQLAALMREDGDTWPSDAYIRLMLGAKGPDPSERFCDRFLRLADHIYNALAGGDDVVALVTSALDAPDTYDPAEHVRFVAIPPNIEVHPAIFSYAPGSRVALSLIPDELLGHCEHDACGAPFIRRVPWQRFCCQRCSRAAARERRLASLKQAVEEWLAVEARVANEIAA